MKGSSRIPVIIIIAATVFGVLTLALFYLRRAEPPPPSTPRPEASPSPDHQRVLDAAKKLTEKGYDLKLEGKNGEALEMFARQSLDFEPEWAVEQSTPEFAAIESVFVSEIELAVMGFQGPAESLEAISAEYREARFQ